MAVPVDLPLTASRSRTRRQVAALRLAAAYAVLSLSAASIMHCAGTTDSAPSESSLCERARTHILNCGASQNVRTCPSNHSPDLDCESACDLELSCDYFLGRSPAESRQRSQCGSLCTCQSAKRRATECGSPAQFACDRICNCPYSNICTFGIVAYAECRAQCPPWPEPTDASDYVDASVD